MKKRFLSILATLCLCLTLLPSTALAESGSIDQATFVVTNWGALQTQLEDPTKDVINATLESDIEWGGSSLTVPEGKNVTINLNAHSIDAQNQGTVIKVYGTLTLENTGDIGWGGGPGSGSDSGRLMNGTSGDKGGAGGILIADGGTLIMNGGWIYNCTSTNSSDGAGGVYVSEGATFEMSAGVIRQCNGHPSEGLLSTASGVVNRGTFTMTKFPILYSGNATSTNTSDTIVYNSGTFNANAYSSSPICSSAESNKSNVVNMGTIQSAPNTYGPKFQVPVINMGFGTISGGVYESTVSNSGTISGGTFKGTVNNCDDRGQLAGRISGGDFQSATVNGKYTVNVTAGANMKVTSGSTTQSDLLVKDMTPVVVTADNGYYFPTDYTVAEKDGVKVTRNSASQITVSGMPCFNVDITLPAAEAKTQAAAPSAVFTATGSDTGKLTDVDSGMQYSLDGSNWTDINGSSAELSGLTSSTEIQIIKKGGATATDSDVQTITLTQAATPTASFAATGTDAGKLDGVSSGMQYRIDNGAWKDISENSADLTGLSNGTVIHVRTKGTGNTLFSQSQDITLEQAATPNATFAATGTSTGTLSGVTTGMKYKIGDGEWIAISSDADIPLNDLSACTISIMRNGGEELDSETQTISVTKPNVPAATAQNCINGNDGKLTGVDDTMEYHISGEESWIAIDSSEVTDLAAGSYEVRYKASGTALASAPQTVTIGSYAAQLTKSNGDVSYYDSLVDAFDAAKNNSDSTVKLLQDCASGQISITNECNFTIDLNGKTITSTDTALIRLDTDRREQSIQLINTALQDATVNANQVVYLSQNSHLTIGTPNGSSNILFELSDTLFTAGDNSNGTTITIYGGTYKTTGDWAVSVQNKGAAAKIYGGSFTGGRAGVRLHNNTSPNDSLTIYGGTFRADNSEGFGLLVSGRQSKAQLQGGTYNSIYVTDSNSLSSILSAGYAYKDNTNGWVNNPNGNSLTKVTVQKVPIQNLSVTAPTETVYGQSVSITATPTLLDPNTKISYKWYQGNTEIAGANESVYTAVGLDADSYTFRCEVSCDGYITSKSVDLKVTKADCQITPPTAKENLVYTGKEQALITAGTAIGGTMQYCLTQDGTYSENVPTGKNTGSYTVWYQIIGDSNHNDSAPASVSVTIARQPVDVPEADATVFTYDGEKKTYTIAANDNYTVANAEQTNAGTYTVTVTLKDTENFVWNDKTDAAKGYTFVIAPAKVTVTIKDKSAYVGSKTAPDLSNPEKDKDYTISGLIGEDTLTGSVKLKYDPATPDLTKVSDMTQITDNGSTLANSNYDVTYVDGKLTVTYRPSSGGSSSGSSTVKTETTKNDDGSTTKTETKKDGTVIETTTGKDGSVTKTETKAETKPDGTKAETKSETVTNKDGSKVESETRTETKKDGTVTESKTETITSKDGTKSETKSETKTDKNGVTSGTETTKTTTANGSTGMTVTTIENGESKTAAEAKVSGKAVEDAKKNGEAVKAPVEIKASRDSSTAPVVNIELPKGAGETKVEIPVSNATPGTVAVLVHPDGTEEILKDSVPTEDGIQLTVDGSATVKIVDNSKGFIDTQDHWAKDAIDFVSARGLVNGMTATIYAPNASTTRAQLWTILARQNDADLNGGNTWFENAQNWAKEKGISDGANPNGTINRAQMVTMLWRAMDQPAPAAATTFTDVSADAYYASAVSWAVEHGITTGVGGGRFDPAATCTRAQIAAFLARSMK